MLLDVLFLIFFGLIGLALVVMIYLVFPKDKPIYTPFPYTPPPPCDKRAVEEAEKSCGLKKRSQ